MSTVMPWDIRKAIQSIYQTPLSPLVYIVYSLGGEFRAYLGSPGAFTVGKINDEERFDVVRHSCPGAGACGGMYTRVFHFFNSPFETDLICETVPIQ